MKLLGIITKDYTINILKWGYLNKKFSENFILSIQQDIGSLLNKTIQKYCRNSSTSVTVEVGEQLLESIYYTMDANFRDDFNMDKYIELFKQNSIEVIFKMGEQKLKDLFEETKQIYNRVCQNKYNTEVIAYNNTLLKEFGNFFDIYDMKFNAQDIKISVDYPLIFGDNNLNGLYYIKNYLEIIELENKFCNHFKSKEVELLLDINARRYKLDYRDLLTNIFEIVINNTILSTIIDGEFKDFYIFEKEMDYLKSNLNLDNIEQEVENSINKIIENFNIDDEKEIQYISLYKNKFIQELKSCIMQDSIENIVVICDIDKEEKSKIILTEDKLSDDGFRDVLDKIENENNINKKVDIIKSNINSFDDFCDILKSDCFYNEEYKILFDSLEDIELALLGKFIFFEEIEMSRFNFLNEIFKERQYDYIWQESYIEYMKNQVINKINNIQNYIMSL